MRMSRRIGLCAISGMYPDTVTINSGSKTQYWASSSGTDDKWHNTSTNPGGVPFGNYKSYFGRNASNVYHNLALCFKTPNFSGKGTAFTCKFNTTSTWGWSFGLDSRWQLSKHDWSTADAWGEGSKSYYSKQLSSSAPNDPNAVANDSFTVNNTSSKSVTFNGEATLLPNTEYVLYIWANSTYAGAVVELPETNSQQPVITITG